MRTKRLEHEGRRERVRDLDYGTTFSSSFLLQLEMFLSRLNFYEFRVRPLGLFEISNELILVFLSGLITYLTYILQYGMQSHRI